MKTSTFKKSPLAQSIAVALGVASMSSASAQESEPLVMEEVVVMGIRTSLMNAMDTKRDSRGVVDALSAEDIGKFPDTNLAESLQRITGVSIDRNTSGEGSKVTVRGFGPDFNVVLLNGRQMPNAALENTEASKSRSFDFAQLAAEAVSGIEIYKTGKARLPSGGIGSTLNILTTRPLDNPGLTASLSGKTHYDESNDSGDDEFTPDFSGIYSNTFADDTIGVAVSASYAERNGGFRAADTTSGWNTFVSDGVDAFLPGLRNFTNPPQAGDVVGWPQDFRYVFNDFQRERTNAQLTLQWQPIDSVRTTLDYTYSELLIDEQRQELSSWFGVPVAGELTVANGAGVVAPVIYTDGGSIALGLAAGEWSRKSEISSLGFNIEWHATENLSLSLDYHDSEGEAGPNSPLGSHNLLGSSTWRKTSTTVDYRSDFARLDAEFDPNQFPCSDFDCSTSGADAIFADGNSFRDSYMKTDIEQFQLHGSWSFDDSFIESIDFGLAHTAIDNRSAFTANNGGDWGGGIGYTGQLTGGGWNSPAGDGDANFDNSAFVEKNLPGEFDDLSSEGVLDTYWDVNMQQLMADAYAYYEAGGAGGIPAIYAHCAPGTFCPPSQFQVDRLLSEDTDAAYVQANFYWDWNDKPINLAVGLRYDSTDVEAEALSPNYSSLLWLTANELQLQSSGDGIFLQDDGDYDYWLPNIDFDIELLRDVIFRASYGETITRASYEDLQGGTNVSQQARTDGNSSGRSGNTGLKPFESENWDFSVEWYYNDASYLSVGYYNKKVDNFIGTGVVNRVVYPGLVQPRSGPREQEALANVVNPSNAGLEVLNYYRDQGWVDAVTGELLGSLDSYDPLVFTLTVPSNAEDAEIDGFEIALQHVFGDSGFGGIINYTTVDGDIEYDDGTIGVNQFALLGLSDSYNIIGFYDKHGLQVRLAYNWRDEFLESTTQGNNQQEPVYVEDYGQLDFYVSYTFDGFSFSQDNNLTLFAEGINVTDEKWRKHGRHENMVVSSGQTGARYAIGLRYSF